MSAVRTITREALGKEWGISPNVIDNMLQRGQLQKVARGLIDYDHAVKVRAAQSPAARERAIVAKAAKGEAPPSAPPAIGRADAGRATEEAPAAHATADVMLKARAAKTLADAKIAQLNHDKLKGSLVEVDRVKQDAANAARTMVARLNALPSRLGPMLATISDPAQCIKEIEKEVGRIVTEMREALAAL